MKKTNIRKLTLNRETLMPLDGNDLENVQGGNIVRSAIEASKASIRACSKAVSAVSRWVSRNACSAISLESVAETVRRTQQGGNGE